MNDGEFRDSIRFLGPLLPVLKCAGHVVDGRKREQIALETDHIPRVLELTPAQATRALWLLHPERAIEREGKRTVAEYAQAFGVRTLTVAEYLQAHRRESTPIVTPNVRQGPSENDEEREPASVLVSQWWPARLRNSARAAAEARGQNLSAFVREAVATHVARTMPHEQHEPLEVVASACGLGSGKSGPRRARAAAGVVHRSRESDELPSHRRIKIRR